MRKILVTGGAGFIGFHLTKRLLEQGDEVIGIDNINDYYATSLKYGRLAELGIQKHEVAYNKSTQSNLYPACHFIKLDLTDRDALQILFQKEHFDVVVNLAAQAGVRYSIENPYAYIESNLIGFINILECCRHNPVQHLVYASSSSVYGENTKVPFAEDDRTDSPVSLYAATKKADELMARVYTKLYKMPITGLRFFTVYGPWGRPDMAPMLFTKAILAGESIKVFNNGDLSRDFTYVDDIVEGVVRVIDHAPNAEDPAALYNIGCGHPMQLMDFIHTLEESLGKKAQMTLLPMQQGDVYTTYADTTKLKTQVDYQPTTSLKDGIQKFVQWYKNNQF